MAVSSDTGLVGLRVDAARHEDGGGGHGGVRQCRQIVFVYSCAAGAASLGRSLALHLAAVRREDHHEHRWQQLLRQLRRGVPDGRTRAVRRRYLPPYSRTTSESPAYTRTCCWSNRRSRLWRAGRRFRSVCRSRAGQNGWSGVMRKRRAAGPDAPAEVSGEGGEWGGTPDRGGCPR